MGYLYVMGAKSKKGDSFCKVGISEHDPDIRKANVQTGCPFPIERIWVSRDIPDYKLCERIIHKELNEYRTSGEWFEIPFAKCVIIADKTCKTGFINSITQEIESIKSMQKITNTKIAEIDKLIDFIKYDQNGCLSGW